MRIRIHITLEQVLILCRYVSYIFFFLCPGEGRLQGRRQHAEAHPHVHRASHTREECHSNFRSDHPLGTIVKRTAFWIYNADLCDPTPTPRILVLRAKMKIFILIIEKINYTY